MPSRVSQNIQNSENKTKPYISIKLVEEKIQKAKNTKKGVPGDLPIKLAKEFGPKLAIPAARIFNNIVKTGVWPSRWKEERGIPLNKVKPKQPNNEEDLRVISLTPFLSKTFKSIVIGWLFKIVGPKLDLKQYGGVKCNSCSHYLIDFITYILYNQDLMEPKVVVASMVDFEKAFNWQNHNKLQTKLHDLGVPGWLLNIVKGFLENRTRIVSFKGEQSDSKKMPGGGPQGTVLGLFLFIVLINEAGFKDETDDIGKKITASINKRKEIPTSHWKYVDNLTIAEAIDLKKFLECQEESSLTRPLKYHDQTEHVLPLDKSRVQEQLNDSNQYASANEMKEKNRKKTKTMPFKTAKKRDFTPTLSIGGEEIELVEEMKLLGLVLTSDLKWSKNTEYTVKRGYNKLWLLRRLKQNGANTIKLCDICEKHVRIILEYGAVVWHASSHMLIQ